MVQHSNGAGSHDIILYHDVNAGFSKFLAEVLKSMATDLSFKYEILDADAKILRVRIKENSVT
jgi:hypothetical protein